MKTICLFATLLFSPGPAQAMIFWDALAQIESGKNDFAIGAVGEVSRYQIRPEVWRVYSSSKRYQDWSEALPVARNYMAKLQRDFLRATGRPATEVDCVILWKSGIAGYKKEGFIPGRMSPAHQDRIRRFRNLRSVDVLQTRTTRGNLAPVPVDRNAPTQLQPQAIQASFTPIDDAAPQGFSLFGESAPLNSRIDGVASLPAVSHSAALFSYFLRR